MKQILKPFLKILSLKRLKGLQYSTGLFGASKPTVNSGYDKAWIRDNIYEAMAFEYSNDLELVKRTYHALFNVLKVHEYKIDWAIKEKPDQKHKYIHARYNPTTLEEFHEDWGNMQNDAIGAFLFKVGDLYKKGIMLFRDQDDLRILQKLVDYLQSIEFWHDDDNGIWEENEEIHASSVGACLAGIIAVQDLANVPEWLIEKGQDALDKLLPNESCTKSVDLSLLSLIFPYNVCNDEQKSLILKNVEEKLVRKRGVIRYIGDKYYEKDGKEAEWSFGFPWLAKIYKDLNNIDKYKYYLKKTIDAMNWKGELPELYYGGTNVHNENTPLGWGQSLYVCAVS